MEFEILTKMYFTALLTFSFWSTIYIIQGCISRIRYPSSQIKHAWKLIYVTVIGLAGWSLCDLVGNTYTAFQQFVSVAVAIYFVMTKDAWHTEPPVIAKNLDKHSEANSYSYSDARNLIKTGDMIGVATGTLGGRIIELGQVIAGVPYTHITHNAIAYWIGGRLMVVEMGVAGNVYKPLSQYAGKRMVVCSPPNNSFISKFNQAIDTVTKNHIPYSSGDLVRIAVRLLLLRFINTKNWGNDSNKNKVCSLLPAMVYQEIGGNINNIPNLAAPAEVVEALTVRFEIKG